MAPTASIDPLDVSSFTALDAALLRCDDACTRRLVRELDESDPALADHGAGVAAVAVAVGRRLQFGADRLETVCRAALLHDVGKRLVPRELLVKPGVLSAPERRVVEGHAAVGSVLLVQEGLLSEASIVRHHHERWDGAGYPDRLCGREIPLESRIILVADTFDAMTSDRPYRAALSHEDALEEIRLAAGSQLDPACVAHEGDRLVYVHRPTPGGEPDDLRRFADPLIVAFTRTMELVEARRHLTPLTFAGGQQVHLEDFPRIAVREALSNAVVHRDYHQRAAVTLSHSPQILEVSSPGPLVAGVTPDNILTHASKPRNAALAMAARLLGLAEEVGAGVDRMYREMLASGKDIPTIESTQESVRIALVGGAPNTRIAAYLRELTEEERNDVDTLLVLGTLCQRESVDAPAIAPLLQKPDASTQIVLERLAQDSVGMLEPTRGTFRRRHPRYRLREHVMRTLGTAVRYRRRGTDELDRKVTAHVKEYDRITNRTVRNLFDVDVNRARDILADMVQREILVKTSEAARGPSVEYGPGPKFQSSRGSRPAAATRSRADRPQLFPDD